MPTMIAGIIHLMQKIPHSLLALLGRLAIGLVFWNSGRTKVDGWDIFHVNEKTLFLFQEEYRLPYLTPGLAAMMAQMAEHIFPVLLILGLATRFSALALFIMTLVIEIFVYSGAYVVHGTWATILLMLMKYGPGKISLDHLIATR